VHFTSFPEILTASEIPLFKINHLCMKELVSAESNKERDVYAWDAAADWRQIRAFDFFQKTF